MFHYLRSALRGPDQARAAHRQALLKHPSIVTGMEQLQRALPSTDPNGEEAPIFLFSAGWRSGSTLLQRLIMSDSRVLIWGEPYDECGMIQALADSMQAFRAEWPPAEYYYDGTPPADLSGNWIANLFPSLVDLRKAHRAFFDTLFSLPAKHGGATRWGIKEVRLSSEHAHYLRWLYPKAKFVFLYRHPLDAYRSYARYGRSWYDLFPNKPMFTPTAFGTHWRRLMQGYLSDAKKLDALLVRYEDLIGERPPLAEIDAYLGIRMNHAILGDKVGSSERGGQKARLSTLEKWLLKRAVSPMAKELGYDW